MPNSSIGSVVGVMYGESVSSSNRSVEEVRSNEDEAKARMTADVFKLVEYVTTPNLELSEKVADDDPIPRTHQ